MSEDLENAASSVQILFTMPTTIRVMFAMTRDQSCWVATAQDGTVVRKQTRDEAEDDVRTRLRERYGADVEVAAEVIWPDSYLRATSEVKVAKKAMRELAEQWRESSRSLVLRLLLISTGGALRAGLDNVSSVLKLRKSLVYAALDLDPQELENVEPATAGVALEISTALEKEIAALHATRNRYVKAAEEFNHKQEALIYETWKVGLGPEPAAVGRTMYIPDELYPEPP